MPDLFSPIKIGSIDAKNRVLMAPLTRARGSREAVPTEIMATYYRQRASAGLIISEAVGISRSGLGWPHATGIWNEEQIEKWKLVTQAVHDEGGRIICQLWHMGRAAHSSVSGSQPLSSSATTFPLKLRNFEGKVDAEEARALTIDEIKQVVKDYAQAAKNAMQAGFDGVQVHAANGYLIDQFLRDGANKRTDQYGGSIGNRVRILDEVLTAVVDAVGADRTSVRLSPNGEMQGVIDSKPETLFKAAAEIVESKKIAMLELREASTSSTFSQTTEQPQLHSDIRKIYKGVLVLNQDYSREEALEVIENGTADAVSFGRFYISNPSLVEKFKENKPLVDYGNFATKWIYAQGPDGYVDYI